MRLRSLDVTQFRNAHETHLVFGDDPVTLLLGFNGAGKTNILESISILSLSKSFLGIQDSDLIEWEKDFYRLTGEVESDAGQRSAVEVACQRVPRKQKALFINDVRKPAAEFVGYVPTVTFLPQDLELFTGSPALRRRFLDELLSQVSPEYIQSLSQYQKILKQRNALLKKVVEGIGKHKDLENCDNLLADQASTIILRRLELMEILQCTIIQEIQELGESWDDVQLQYSTKPTEKSKDALYAEIIDLLAHYQERDLVLQTTSIGPHRDDWHIEVNGHMLQSFASRGQQRTAILALLFLKVSFLELRRGEKPIILLDDVFSELDDNHQSALLASMNDHQVIMTSTHQPPVLENMQIWEVENGKVAVTQ